MNSEEPFDVRHYLSKTLHLQFVLKTFYKEYRIGLWMVPLYYLSFTCRSTPHRRAHKKAVLPTPGLFIERSYAAVLFNNLCRKQREPDLHCINKKKPGYPHNRCYCFTRPQILRTLHPKKHNKKLILICPPSLYPQPPGPGPKTSSPGCLGDGW